MNQILHTTKVDLYPIRQVTLLKSSGLYLYHYSDSSLNLDPLLFTGFMSAVIGFSAELGNKLSTIKMEEVSYYFRSSIEGIIILIGVDSTIQSQKVNCLIDRVSQNAVFHDLIKFNQPKNSVLSIDAENKLFEILTRSKDSLFGENNFATIKPYKTPKSENYQNKSKLIRLVGKILRGGFLPL